METPKDILTDTITIGDITYSADMATVLSADKSITSFQLERGVRYIGENAFAGCPNLCVVRIPKTVIRIEDFAFKDCQNLREVHLPYYIEYISPLAFSLSDVPGNTFYNSSLKVFFPKEAFRKFAYMIPQFLSASDYENSGLTDDDYDFFDELPIYTNEDELYRMVIKDHIQNYYETGDDINGDKNIIDADIQAIGDDVIDLMFKFGFGDLIDKNEFADTNKHRIIISIDESFGALIEHIIKDWLNFMPNLRPLSVLHMALNESLVMGFIPASTWDNPDDKELYGDRLYYYLKGLYVDISGGFYNDEVENNERLNGWYDRLKVDSEVMLEYFVKTYSEYGHPINTGALKEIVRRCMRILFHVGYSYGLKYQGTSHCFNRKPNYDPCLFSEQEMQGGVCIDCFDQKEDAYLEAIRIVCKLDDFSFIALGEEVEQQYRFAEKYWIRSLPGYIMSHSQFEALREIIGIRHGYNNNYYSFQKPHVTFLASFEKAKKRFEDELPKEEYKYVEWITSI